jgi:glycosyltransferase involved in cell wall biosynthesis
MNLLFLTNFYPPHEIGGYEQLCQELADALRLRRHRLTVLTSNYQRPADGAATALKQAAPNREEGVLRSLFLDAPLDHYQPLDFFRQRRKHQAWNQRQLQQCIERLQPDVVLVWGMWNLSLLLPALAETLLPGRVAYYLCSYWPADVDAHSAYWQLPANRRLTEWVKKPLRRLAQAQLRQDGCPPRLGFKHVRCVSHFVRQHLVEQGKIPAEAGVIYNGIEVDRFWHPTLRPPSPRLRLLYSGRLIADKGVHTALEALLLLRQGGLLDRIQLTILGSGHPDYEARLQALVSEHQLQSCVNFVRFAPRQQVAQYLAEHDVFLFTSLWPEPLARSVMEAMAAGMLVIGTPVGGQAEMLHDGEDSLVYASNDAMQLARQIERALCEPELRLRLASAGQTQVQRTFTMLRMVDEMESFLDRV